MSPRDVTELLGPITDQWRCRSCHKPYVVPSLARDCELVHLEHQTQT